MPLFQTLAGNAVQPVRIGNNLAFFAPKTNAEGEVLGVLWGRIDLAASESFQQVNSAADGLLAAGGEVLIVSGTEQIIYSSDLKEDLEYYAGSCFLTATSLKRLMLMVGIIRNISSRWEIMAGRDHIHSDHLINSRQCRSDALILAGFALIVLEAGIAV